MRREKSIHSNSMKRKKKIIIRIEERWGSFRWGFEPQNEECWVHVWRECWALLRLLSSTTRSLESWDRELSLVRQVYGRLTNANLLNVRWLKNHKESNRRTLFQIVIDNRFEKSERMRSRIPRTGLFGAIFRFFQFLCGFFLLSERRISKRGEYVWQICRKNLWLETDFDLIKEQLLCQITCFANSPFSFTDFQALFMNRIATSLKRKRIKTFEKKGTCIEDE